MLAISLSLNAERRFVCLSIMEASSLVVSWIYGHITTACRLTSAVPANQPTTAGLWQQCAL